MIALPPVAHEALLNWVDAVGNSADPMRMLARGTFDGAWTAEMDNVPENPGAPGPLVDADFRVVVPVTGGMDSTTLWHMAREAGVPAEPLYVDVGQPYAQAELAAVGDLVDAPVAVLGAMAPTGGGWQHIIPRRNAIIVMRTAAYMAERGWWGELWFGNLAGETPARGGDKSSRFFATTQQLLAGLGYDVQLVQPLRGLDKTDVVRWWQARGAVDVLRRTKSCLAATARACGRCQTCFRKMVAFRAAGEGTDGMFDAEEWGPFVAKYRVVMGRAVAVQDWTRYSPARCRDTLAVIAELEAA